MLMKMIQIVFQKKYISYGDLLDGTSTADVSTVDDDGNMNKDKKLAQVFDPQVYYCKAKRKVLEGEMQMKKAFISRF